MFNTSEGGLKSALDFPGRKTPTPTRLDIGHDSDAPLVELRDHRFEIRVPLFVHPKDISVPIVSDGVAGGQVHPGARDVVFGAFIRPVFEEFLSWGRVGLADAHTY